MAGRPREGQAKGIRETDAGKFGQRLESLIDKSGLTVKEFADLLKVRVVSTGITKAGISTDAIYLWFKGINQPPYRYWRTIANVLNQRLPARDRLKNLRELLPDSPLSAD